MQKVYYEELRTWFDNEGQDIVWKMMSKWRGKFSVGNDSFFIFARALINGDMKNENDSLKNNKSIDILFNRIDSRYSEIIEEIRETFDEKQLKSIVLNFSRNSYIEKSRMIENLYIHEGLGNLINSLLEIKEGDRVLHPYSRSGDYITDYLVEFPDNVIIGLDFSTDNVLASQIKASLVAEEREKFSIVQSDYLNVDLDEIDYNKIFSVPPFSVTPRLFQDIVQDEQIVNYYEENKQGSYSNWIYLLKAIQNLKFQRVVFLVTSNILFSNRDAKIRKHLIERGLIEGIIELPPRMFVETAITTNIVIVSKGNKTIKMVDASEMYSKERMRNVIDEENQRTILESYYSNSEKSKIVGPEELEENDYNLLPRRYANEELDLENYVYLKDIAEIKRGYANIKQEELNERISDVETNNKLLTAGDINDEFSIGELDSLIDIKDNEKVYCIENREIAISRGGNYKSVLIRKEDESILANGTLYIIRCDEEKINPYYLQMYLSSEHCLKQIDILNAGTVISFISISQLGELKIPRVSKELEKEISEKYKSILDRYEIIRLQKNKLKDETREIISEVI